MRIANSIDCRKLTDQLTSELIGCFLDCDRFDIEEAVVESFDCIFEEHQRQAAWYRALGRAYGELVANLYETDWDGDKPIAEEIADRKCSLDPDFERLSVEQLEVKQFIPVAGAVEYLELKGVMADWNPDKKQLLNAMGEPMAFIWKFNGEFMVKFDDLKSL